MDNAAQASVPPSRADRIQQIHESIAGTERTLAKMDELERAGYQQSPIIRIECMNCLDNARDFLAHLKEMEDYYAP